MFVRFASVPNAAGHGAATGDAVWRWAFIFGIEKRKEGLGCDANVRGEEP